MPKLTDLQLRSLTLDQVGQRLSDGGGLFGTVRHDRQRNCPKVFFEYRYRSGTRTRSIKCGTWSMESLKDIRQRRDAYRLKVSEGIDPQEESRLNHLQQKVQQAREIEHQQAELARLAAEKAARRTMNMALSQWYETELSRRKNGGKETIRAINKDVVPKIGEVSLPEVKRVMLIDILDSIVQRGARVMANRLSADLRQFFEFCVMREWITVNPLANLTKDRVGGTEPERERVLSQDEIKELNAQLPTANLQATTQLAIWIMLSTCCRVGELSQARWEDVNLERRQWRIPPENSKNGREHIISLSDFAYQQFEALRVLTGTSTWCYPATHRDGHICLKSISKQVHDRQRETPLVHRTKATESLLLSRGAWTVHDLRRTAATLMGELGVMGEVIERCLNHVESSKLKRTYQRHDRQRDMRDAWEKLGERLDLLTRADVENVVLFRRQR